MDEPQEKLEFFEEEDEARSDVEEPSKPKDTLKVVVNDVRKEGNDWTYGLQVTLNNNPSITMQRQYKDIQWMHKSLLSYTELGGYIVPPLPPSPSSIPDLPSTGVIEKCEAMFGGMSRRHTLRLELFLRALAEHHFFIENHIVYNFLTKEKLSSRRDSFGSGMMWNLSKVYNNFSLSGIADPDEKFESFLKYVNEILSKIGHVYETISEYIFSWQRLGNEYVLTKAALQDVAVCDKSHSELCHYESQMAEGLFDIGVNECLVSLDAALSLAIVFSYQSGFFEHCKEMLQRRLIALQTFLNANQQLDKAKPAKREAAERAKVKAEENFHELSKIATKEVDYFTDQYRKSLKQGLLSYTEARIAHSRRTLESLTQIRENLLNPMTSE